MLQMRGLLAICALCSLACFACHSVDNSQELPIPGWQETGYDSAYAAHLGADAYGMRPYVLVLLRQGPNRDQDSLTAAKLQRAHLDNMSKWAEDGLLVMAGPTYDTPTDLQGLYVFALNDTSEVNALAAEDPAIKAGRLVMETYPWYSSAALMDVNRIHDRIGKEGI